MRLWQIQRWTAIALLVFLTLHMIVVHYPPFHITFDRILERLAQPGWKAIDIAFLFVVLLHALTGAWAVLTDFEAVHPLKRWIAIVGIVVGVAAFLYGAQTILSFQPPA